MKNFLSFLFLFALPCLVVTSCINTTSHEYRLGEFYKLIGEKNSSSFKKGDLNEIVHTLKKEYKTNAEFQEKWDAMKSHEGINFFSVQEVVEFFYNSFYQRDQ